jgi:hypothetical protein
MIVYSREDKQSGQFNNLVRYAEPPRDAGKLVLLKGGNLWFYDPASKASIRISPQQRLTGQASEGDVSRSTSRAITPPESSATRTSRTPITRAVTVGT